MPPIRSVTSVPPDMRPEPRVRERQRLATDMVDQVQRAIGARVSQAQASPTPGAPMQLQARAGEEQPRLQPPLDLVQRFFSERQTALREAALQRDEVLHQEENNQRSPLLQAQREADRLQVMRDVRLLETQRTATQRVEPTRDTERLQGQRLDAQRQTESALTQQDTERVEQQRAEEEREAERIREQEDAEQVEQQRAEEARNRELVEQRRVQGRDDSERVELARAEQVRVPDPRGTARQVERAEDPRTDVDTEAQARRADIRPEAERVLVERAALAYRSQSERATADATAARLDEAAQPLNQQLQLARDRLDSLEAVRIDRVDVSNAALSRLAF